MSWQQRISCESTGHSVGAVPFCSWLSCVRNLDKNKNKKAGIGMGKCSINTSSLAPERLRYKQKGEAGKAGSKMTHNVFHEGI